MKLLILIVALSILFIGCGQFAAGQAHGLNVVLNELSDVVNPSYDLAIQVCEAKEQVIELRQGTTLEEDQAALREVRTRCDAIFNAFNKVREAQLDARTLAQRAEENPKLVESVYAAVLQASNEWARVRELMSIAGFITERPNDTHE